jgi:phosphohistidine phosphatase
MASLEDLLDVVVAQDDGFNSLMIVCHNPGLTDFANFLVPGLTNNLPTAGVVSEQIDQEDWSLYKRPKTTLLAFDYPKLNA